jgi:hypothetical protein
MSNSGRIGMLASPPTAAVLLMALVLKSSICITNEATHYAAVSSELSSLS